MLFIKKRNARAQKPLLILAPSNRWNPFENMSSARGLRRFLICFGTWVVLVLATRDFPLRELKIENLKILLQSIDSLYGVNLQFTYGRTMSHIHPLVPGMRKLTKEVRTKYYNRRTAYYTNSPATFNPT